MSADWLAMTVLTAMAKRLAFIADDVVSSTSGVVVLGYHRVGGRTASPVDLPAREFEDQLEHLAVDSEVITIDDGLDRLAAGEPGTVEASFERPVVLTFDDGTEDFADVVLPLLVEYRVPATLYVTTAHVDSRSAFPGGGVPLTWNALRECVSTGLVTVGAHTHTHALLDRCDPFTVDLELDVSNDRIESELGIRPAHFAYPKALAGTPHAERAVRVRYRSAAVAGTRPNVVGATDQYRLHRSPVQNADGWEGFVRKARGGMRTEDDVRRFVNTVRYLGRAS